MMDGHECVSAFLGEMVRAELRLSGERPGEVRFNDTSSPGAFWAVLAGKECRVLYEVFRIKVLSRHDKGVRNVVRQYLMDMQGLVTFRDGHYTHRFLHAERDGVPVSPETLTPAERLLTDEYLRLQGEAYARLHVLVMNTEAAPSSPYHLDVSESEAAELLDVIGHSGRLRCYLPESTKRDFTYFFCRAWNWPLHKDYDTLTSHAGARPNPTVFIDTLKKNYGDYLEKKSR